MPKALKNLLTSPTVWLAVGVACIFAALAFGYLLDMAIADRFLAERASGQTGSRADEAELAFLRGSVLCAGIVAIGVAFWFNSRPEPKPRETRLEPREPMGEVPRGPFQPIAAQEELYFDEVRRNRRVPSRFATRIGESQGVLSRIQKSTDTPGNFSSRTSSRSS